MARIDKYQSGFRARLGFQPLAAEVGDIIPVVINGSSLAVKTTDSITCDGIIVLSSLLNQNDYVDVMTGGEVVDIVAATDNVAGAAAGATLFAVTGGATGVTAPVAGTNATKIGKFVEAWRLVVRVARWQG
jgi:hypothetical protein